MRCANGFRYLLDFFNQMGIGVVFSENLVRLWKEIDRGAGSFGVETLALRWDVIIWYRDDGGGFRCNWRYFCRILFLEVGRFFLNN